MLRYSIVVKKCLSIIQAVLGLGGKKQMLVFLKSTLLQGIGIVNKSSHSINAVRWLSVWVRKRRAEHCYDNLEQTTPATGKLSKNMFTCPFPQRESMHVSRHRKKRGLEKQEMDSKRLYTRKGASSLTHRITNKPGFGRQLKFFKKE